MAKYSIELKDVVESNYNIFDFPYEIYDEDKRKDFEQKFVDHFYFREICCETVPRFKHYLKCKFNEVLPYYNMLFRASLIEYEKVINYNLTESFTRDVEKVNAVTGNIAGTGSNNDSSSMSTETNKLSNGSDSQDSTNVLNSVTNHDENNETTKHDEVNEANQNGKTSTKEVDNTKVDSDTPNGLLAMSSIKKNVYASKAMIDDNTEKVIDEELLESERTGDSSETNHRKVVDDVKATTTNHGSASNQNNEQDKTTGTTSLNGSFQNATTNSQNSTGADKENYTKIMRGSYGVITEADMVQKHIDLQATLTTIHKKFYEECEDLFMQLY